MTDSSIYDRFVVILDPYVRSRDAFDAASRDSRILDDLQVNSARLVDIVVAMEDEFGILIQDEDFEGLATIGDAVDLIARRVSDRETAIVRDHLPPTA
jgi:acyl carrier protein